MFINTPVFRVDDTIVFGLRQPAAFKANTDSTITVPAQYAGRLDTISNMFYGSPDFWWAVADLNDLVDPFLTPAGANLRVGSRQNQT